MAQVASYEAVGGGKLEHHALHNVPLYDIRKTGRPDLKTDGFTYVDGRKFDIFKKLGNLSGPQRKAQEKDSEELVKDMYITNPLCKDTVSR